MEEEEEKEETEIETEEKEVETEKVNTVEKIEMYGKTYVEFNVVKHLKFQKMKDILILILIVAAVLALVIAIVTLVKNKDIINKDALIIGMNTHGFVSCQCLDEEGIEWSSTQTGFITQPRAVNPFEGLGELG